MATKHSEDSLRSLKKDDLIKLILKIQDETDSKIEVLTKEVRGAFQRIESDIEVVRNTNSLLNQRVIDLERECYSNSQYSRRSCIEIVGIPESVSGDQLEDKVLEIFGMINIAISKEKIESCHRLHNKKTTIIKFGNRKDALNILKAKKNLKNLDLTDIVLTVDQKLSLHSIQLMGLIELESGKPQHLSVLLIMLTLLNVFLISFLIILQKILLVYTCNNMFVYRFFLCPHHRVCVCV